MSALNSFGAENRIVDSQYAAPIIRQDLISGDWVGKPLVESSAEVHYNEMVHKTRTNVASIRYVGMTKTAAASCAAAAVSAAEVTIPAYRWDSTAGDMGDWVLDGYVSYSRATVVMRHAEGDMWDVVIDVNEFTESFAKPGHAPPPPAGSGWSNNDF